MSFRRAEAVRSYCKSKGAVWCAGVKPKEKLIKCLAPNRRVAIEWRYGQ